MKKNILISATFLFTFLYLTFLTSFIAAAQASDPCSTSQPRPITGNQHPCPGTIETYCIDNDRNYTSFVWDVPRAHAGNPPIGWEIISGQGTNCVTVRVGTKSGTMKVTVEDPICGTKVATLPVKPSNGFSVEITGPELVCMDEEQTFIAVGSDSIRGNGNNNGNIKGNFTYTWSYPADWTLVSGQGTNQLVIIPGMMDGSVTVNVTTNGNGNGNGNNGTGVGNHKSYCNNAADDELAVTPEDCGMITPLPVDLVSFAGSASAEGVVLNWATATEKNNEGFEIERSTDGKSFEAIGKVAGKGNASNLNTYNFTDAKASTGVNYYRLEQRDFDGTTTYSKVIAVSAKGKAMDMSVAPNPVTDGRFSIRMAANANDAELMIVDLSGRIVHKQLVKANSNQLDMNLNLKRGMYVVSLKDGNAVTTQKIVVQ